MSWPLRASTFVRRPQKARRRYRRIKEGRGVKTGDLTGPFFTRPFIDGKQIWETLTAETFTEAKEEAGQLSMALNSKAKGLTVAEAEALTNANRIPIRTAVDTYLELTPYLLPTPIVPGA